MIRKRTSKESINFGPWHLGKWGMSINIFAAAYTFLTVIFTFFPPSVPVNAVTMNWSCVVYGGVVILGVIYYFAIGHRDYVGPSTELDLSEFRAGLA